jgi:hypothetical protein
LQTNQEAVAGFEKPATASWFEEERERTWQRKVTGCGKQYGANPFFGDQDEEYAAAL